MSPDRRVVARQTNDCPMQDFITDFTSTFDLPPPEGCADRELYLAIKATQVCRLDAWEEGTRLHTIGKKARAWLGQPEVITRLHQATAESDPEMRRQCVGVYIVGQCPEFLSVARTALQDSDWGVRCTACEALHDLGLHGHPAIDLKDQLMDVARTDPNFMVRSRAAEALQYYVFDDVIQLLRTIAEIDHEDDDQYMVESPATAAQNALAQMQTRQKES